MDANNISEHASKSSLRFAGSIFVISLGISLSIANLFPHITPLIERYSKTDCEIEHVDLSDIELRLEKLEGLAHPSSVE